jgi:putative hydrolase of the HAD superfamily
MKHDGIRTVIVDYGEVLSLRPDGAALGRVAAELGMAPEAFAALYPRDRGPYDQGVVTADDYWGGLLREAGRAADAGLVERLRRWDVELWSRTDPRMIAWVAALRAAGLTTALLSNMTFDMAAHVRSRFGWLAHFDHQVLSCELRLVKPDPAIFQRCLAAVGARPAEALFVDDRAENVAAARAEGICAIQFQSREQLGRALADLGFPLLPEGACS